jgi:hypothetical protein
MSKENILYDTNQSADIEFEEMLNNQPVKYYPVSDEEYEQHEDEVDELLSEDERMIPVMDLTETE